MYKYSVSNRVVHCSNGKSLLTHKIQQYERIKLKLVLEIDGMFPVDNVERAGTRLLMYIGDV